MCDTRRAVIIVNTIQIIGGIVGAILLGVALKAEQDGTITNEELTEFFAGWGTENTIAAYVAIGIRLLMNLTGVMGALHYSVCMVGTCFVWYVIQAIGAGIAHAWGAMVVTILFAYVHIYFIMEVNSGIMSPQNYHNEKHSCCCV